MGRKLFFFEIWKTIDHRIKKSFKAAAAGPMESITREMYIFFNNQRTTINKLNNLKPINPVEKKKETRQTTISVTRTRNSFKINRNLTLNGKIRLLFLKFGKLILPFGAV